MLRQRMSIVRPLDLDMRLSLRSNSNDLLSDFTLSAQGNLYLLFYTLT